MYSTLYAIRESPVQKGLIWTGSNDGLVSVTRDDGEDVDQCHAEGPAAGRAGAEYRAEPASRRGLRTWRSIDICWAISRRIFIRTDDFGKSWTRLTDGKNGIAADEPTRVVREDPARAGLLYAGTEFGIYVSFDNGGHWQSLQLNLPVTPVTDIKVAHEDLVISTQGRSFWILDDLTPLHQLSEKVAAVDGLSVCASASHADAGRARRRGRVKSAAASLSVAPARRSIIIWRARLRATSRWKSWMARGRPFERFQAPARAGAGRCVTLLRLTMRRAEDFEGAARQ